MLGKTVTLPALDHCCLVTKSGLTLCDPTDCSPPGSSVHGILRARILEWVAFPSPGDLPDPGIKPTSPAVAGRGLYHWDTWEALPKLSKPLLSEWLDGIFGKPGISVGSDGNLWGMTGLHTIPDCPPARHPLPALTPWRQFQDLSFISSSQEILFEKPKPSHKSKYACALLILSRSILKPLIGLSKYTLNKYCCKG